MISQNSALNRETYIRKNLDTLFQHWLARGSAWGALLFLMLSALDYVSAPQHFRLFLKYRLIMSFLLILSSYATIRSASRVVHNVVACIVIGGSAMTIELMILKLGGHTSSYYPGMILLCVAAVGFVPARFSFHVATVCLIYLIYLLPIIALEQIVNVQAFFTSIAFISLIFMTVLVMRYMASQSLVKELGLRYDLEQSKEHLENAVRDRTNELSQVVLRLQQEIADHQRTEKQLQHYTRELEEKNDELKAFVYSISHDLRAPLVNIKGFSGELGNSLKDIYALMHKYAPHLDPEEQTRLQHITQNDIPAAIGFICGSSDKIEDLINSFLKLSHIGRRDLTLEKIDMDSLVRAIVRSFSEKVKDQGVTVNIANLPKTVADRTAMEQVISSLVDNALKYYDPSRRGVVAITGEQAAAETIYHIRDNGRGIAAEDVYKVFDLFRRVGLQDVPGEGMGLAYAKTLIGRHEGRIWCESEPGKGSTFSFSIPYRPEGPQ